jgi:hypothetical protein
MLISDKLILPSDLHRELFTVRHSFRTHKGLRTSFRIRSLRLGAFSDYFEYTPEDLESERKALECAARWMAREMNRRPQYIQSLTARYESEKCII